MWTAHTKSSSQLLNFSILTVFFIGGLQVMAWQLNLYPRKTLSRETVSVKMLMDGCIELGFVSSLQSVTYPSCIICMCLLLYLFYAFTSHGLSSFSHVFHKFEVIVSLIRGISISKKGQGCSNKVPKNEPHTLLPFSVSVVKWTN